jgi:hypothetical protein
MIGMTESTPATMLAALHDPGQLQVFAALITATGPGRQQSRPDPPNTITVAYLTPTGAATRTGLSVPAAARAFQALEQAGLALPSSENPQRNGWRLNTEAFAQAASGMMNQ